MLSVAKHLVMQNGWYSAFNEILTCAARTRSVSRCAPSEWQEIL